MVRWRDGTGFGHGVERRWSWTFHGPIVGLGVAIMSRLQENDPRRMFDLMEYLELEFHPRDLAISRSDLVNSLRSLPAFVRARGFWHTIIDETDEKAFTDASLERLLAGLRF